VPDGVLRAALADKAGALAAAKASALGAASAFRFGEEAVSTGRAVDLRSAVDVAAGFAETDFPDLETGFLAAATGRADTGAAACAGAGTAGEDALAMRPPRPRP